MPSLTVYPDHDRAVGAFVSDEDLNAFRTSSPESDPGTAVPYFEVATRRAGLGFVVVFADIAEGWFASHAEAARHLESSEQSGVVVPLEEPRAALRADYAAAGSQLLETPGDHLAALAAAIHEGDTAALAELERRYRSGQP